jgi:ATP-dependent DNA helicase RecG
VATEHDNSIQLNNAGVLFFAKEPQKFFPEAFITCVKYKFNDRFSILDKKDFQGDPIFQIEEALSFILRHMAAEPKFSLGKGGKYGSRVDLYDFSPIALREAVVNAVCHRDYLYDSSHIYIHMFPDYIEIENPGGLYRGLTVESLGKRSVRRNRLIADLLHRAGYIERVGSGFSRMEKALADNQNPPMEVVATNFFNIRFYKRVPTSDQLSLTQRQLMILRLIQDKNGVSKKDVAHHFNISGDTSLRELKTLIQAGIIKSVGSGKSTIYITL